MTDEETKAMAKLVDDVIRLEGLIKDAEWAGGTHVAEQCCAWCGAVCAATLGPPPRHEANCPAFTEFGAVR